MLRSRGLAAILALFAGACGDSQSVPEGTWLEHRGLTASSGSGLTYRRPPDPAISVFGGLDLVNRAEVVVSLRRVELVDSTNAEFVGAAVMEFVETGAKLAVACGTSIFDLKLPTVPLAGFTLDASAEVGVMIAFRPRIDGDAHVRRVAVYYEMEGRTYRQEFEHDLLLEDEPGVCHDL